MRRNTSETPAQTWLFPEGGQCPPYRTPTVNTYTTNSFRHSQHGRHLPQPHQPLHEQRIFAHRTQIVLHLQCKQRLGIDTQNRLKKQRRFLRQRPTTVQYLIQRRVRHSHLPRQTTLGYASTFYLILQYSPRIRRIGRLFIKSNLHAIYLYHAKLTSFLLFIKKENTSFYGENIQKT